MTETVESVLVEAFSIKERGGNFIKVTKLRQGH